GNAKVDHQRERRMAMMGKYAGILDDPELDGDTADLGDPVPPKPVSAETMSAVSSIERLSPREARELQASLGETTRSVDLGKGVTLELTRIPEAKPLVDEPFWMGTVEVTNEQFAAFDSAHDSRLEHGDFLQFGIAERGFPVDGPQQPVARVSWDRATAFCEWLSEQTGLNVTLPTETQWEHACRAGSDTALWYGGTDSDFSQFANLADQNLSAIQNYAPWNLPSGALMPYRPAMTGVDDGHRVSADVGGFAPNAWGLHDMHGNVAEWTRSSTDDAGEMVVRGGSWYDMPGRATSAFRTAYPRYRGVYDVGFRIVVGE
ncbi:MAG TPA: formylglycine-generating enzyme family protein, partial [Armatimonadota bacterium]|nr:formylglycine-generating enzyme family protein [Armatimonadota bacterium]